ncbi:MAG: hypothetical protein SWH78_09400 [Thermodesulfobacteriota bacterium]|nr:hypothetical protein [Thermodesulfobacteriota bacterium]
MHRKVKSVYGLVLVAAIIVVGAGCVKRADVIQVPLPVASTSQIVSAVLAKDLPGLDPAGEGSSISGWKEFVARIEEFIARHLDEPEIVNPLRIKEAILLLSVGENNLGAAAFNEIDGTHLSDERDKALFDIQETLIWWYGIGGENSGFSREDIEKNAKKALDNLSAVAESLKESKDTKRLLEQIRVRIANRLAGATTDPSETRAILEDGLCRYAAQFDPSEYLLIQNWNQQEPRPGLLPRLSDVRWYEYVPTAFKQAQAAWAIHVRHGEAPLEIPEWVSCMEDGTCP